LKCDRLIFRQPHPKEEEEEMKLSERERVGFLVCAVITVILDSNGS
jgi:hypothetical protein